MNKDFTFTIKSISLDENYHPSENTRITTNFANLARGNYRQANLRNALKMIDNSFNALANWDNPTGERYSVELEIISVDMDIEGSGQAFPSIEILKTNIVDHKTNKRIEGIVGNNFSSYVRDYDFSVLLLDHNKNQPKFSIPSNFGELHGKLFQYFVNSDVYHQNFNKTPVICLSVSDSKTYHRTENQHPVLGIEYLPNESSLTEQYFKKMGLQVRYFMPPNSVAPLAFYFFGDLLNDYTSLELISTISTMETFQKIYRPEIYNANAVAGKSYQPNLKNLDHSLTHIVYDREERSQLANEQGKFTEEHFIKPHQTVLEQWSANFTQ
jgi:Putative oxygenase MesX